MGIGQDFGVQWVLGHPRSDYYFVILHAKDTHRLKDHNEKMLRDYIDSAPASASAPYKDKRYRKTHISCSFGGKNPKCEQVQYG